MWIDHDINYGTRWAAVIQERIRSCAVMLVVMTPEAARSKWIEREILEAEDNDKTIYPLLLRGEMWFLLRNYQAELVVGGDLPSDRFMAAVVAAANTTGDPPIRQRSDMNRAASDAPPTPPLARSPTLSEQPPTPQPPSRADSDEVQSILNQQQTLSLDKQRQLFAALKVDALDEGKVKDAMALLRALRARPDLSYALAVDLDAFFETNPHHDGPISLGGEKLGVTAAPVAAAAAPAAGGGAEVSAVEQEHEFDVWLTGVGARKIQVIKVVRELTNLGLKEAKDLVDAAPKAVLERRSKEDAAKAIAALQAVGAAARASRTRAPSPHTG